MTSRGGGSIWNLLANIAVSGEVARAVGVAGTDYLSSLACSELSQLGVDTSRIHLVDGKSPRVIFENLYQYDKTGIQNT